MVEQYNLYDEQNNVIQTKSLNSILTNTFFRMFLGLLASAITAYYVYSSGAFVKMVENGLFMGLLVVEVVVVLVFSLAFRKLSPTAVTVLFFAYAVLNGFTLSVFFVAYELTSIVYAFFATSALFGVLAFIGYNTEKDISRLGTICLVGLLVGIVLTIINLFIGSQMVDIVLEWFMLAVFCGLTAYDMNKIKLMQEQGFCEDEKLYIYGAMELYLDFINIFIRLLSIFGKRRS